MQSTEKPQWNLYGSVCAISGQDYHREQNMQRGNVRNVHTFGTGISRRKFRNRKRLSLLKKNRKNTWKEKKKKKRRGGGRFISS